MKKLILFLALSCFTIQFIVAQSYKVKWGAVHKKEGARLGFFDFKNVGDDHYNILSEKDDDWSLIKYNFRHQLQAKIPLNTVDSNDEMVLSRFVNTSKGTYTYKVDLRLQKKFIKVYTSKLNQGRFAAPEIAYDHQLQIEVPKYATKKNYRARHSSPNLSTSPDSSCVLLLHRLPGQEEGKLDKVAIAVFDAEMKLMWEKYQPLVYSNKKGNVRGVKLSNEGEVILLLHLSNQTQKKKNKNKASSGEEYRVLHIAKDKVEEYNLNLGPQVIPTDFNLLIPKKRNNEFIITGFYKESEEMAVLAGNFFTRVNFESGEVTTNLKAFDEALLEKLSNEKDPRLSTNYLLDHIVEFENGSYAVVAEHRYNATVSGSGSSGGYRYVFYSNNIIILRFSSEGEFIDLQAIDKYFRTFDGKMTSYVFAFHKDKIHLVYNDLKTAKERRGNSNNKLDKIGRFDTDLVVINAEGQLETRSNLFNSKSIKLIFSPRVSGFKGNTMVLGSVSNVEYSFGTLQLD